MRTIFAAVLTLVVAAGPLVAQPVYNSTPDWESVNTPVSTGGALADLDRDGWLDFVVANGNDMALQRVTVYYNNGDGTYPATPDWSSSDTAYNGHLDVADVNGDGWLDVAVGHLGEFTTQEPIARLYLNSNGILSSLPDWTADIDGNAFSVAFGDVNNDGRPDLAVGTGWTYNPPVSYPTYVYLNVGGALEASASWESDDIDHYLGVLWVDADDDGWLDLVGVGSLNQSRMYRNLGGTLETTASWSTTDNPDQDAIMATAGDVTGDGLRELFITDNTQIGGSGRFRQFDGLVGGGFATTYSWSYFEGYGSAVALADVDADGLLDLVTGGWWEPARYFLNNGTGLPTTPTWSWTADSVIEKICFGDVDNDGQRFPVMRLSGAAAAGGHLFYLGRQPIDAVQSIRVDGALLAPNQFTYDLEHGWVVVAPTPVKSVEVHYIYTLKPDMAITNWDNNVGNYLSYNLNSATLLGDRDDDGDLQIDDYGFFPICISGPGTSATTDCAAVFDADLDGDVDLTDYRRLQLVLVP
ncbi:MAG: VCBS repeat-containing protein [bacterium]|nr:VCBS repeat-containing protein [bacterium]